jgi:transcriptional regulator with XRE-family HTH domain
LSKSLIRSARHRALIAVLVACRKQAGLTQAELAKVMRRTQSFVAQIEKGQRQVYVAELFEFAKAFKLDPQELFRRVATW